MIRVPHNWATSDTSATRVRHGCYTNSTSDATISAYKTLRRGVHQKRQ